MSSESSPSPHGGTTGSQDIPLTARTATLFPLMRLHGLPGRSGYYHCESLAGAAICSSTSAMTEVWLTLHVRWRQKRRQSLRLPVWMRFTELSPNRAIFLFLFRCMSFTLGLKSGRQVRGWEHARVAVLNSLMLHSHLWDWTGRGQGKSEDYRSLFPYNQWFVTLVSYQSF